MIINTREEEIRMTQIYIEMIRTSGNKIEFVYDSNVDHDVKERPKFRMLNGQSYVIHHNGHATERYNEFTMTGKFDGGFTSINFGIDRMICMAPFIIDTVFEKIQ